MTENSEHDVIGELFRQKLENHRLPVGANGWDEIERRLNKHKNKTVIWLWRIGAMAAASAAVMAMLLTINRPETKKETVMAVFQETSIEKSATINHETNTIAPEHEKITPQFEVIKPTNNIALFEQEKTESLTDIYSVNVVVENEILIAVSENDKETQIKENTPEVVRTVKEILKSDILPFEDIPAAKKEKKWLLAAAFSTNGNNSEIFDNTYTSGQAQAPQSMSTRSYNNEYAVNLSSNIKSFDGMKEDNFKNIKHLPPLSFGIMARNLGKHGGIESGLVYTYLSSSFEWSDLSGNYNVHQNLHYVGIPFNMLVHLWNSNPNWQIYLSGGIMVEKGLKAIYTQEARTSNQVRTTTVKKSSVEGVQLSVNSALGVNYKIEKNWGIYFEPRVGYSFDCNQPVSIRTEKPVYFGINLGLNYKL